MKTVAESSVGKYRCSDRKALEKHGGRRFTHSSSAVVAKDGPGFDFTYIPYIN